MSSLRSDAPRRRIGAYTRLTATLTKRAFCIIAAPPRLTAQGVGACDYKPPAVQNGRFVQSPRLKRSKGGGAEFVLPPAKRGFAPPRGRAHASGANVARLRHQMRNGRPGGFERRALCRRLRTLTSDRFAELVRVLASVFSFPQLFQHPPAPQSCGEQQCPAGTKKRASSQAWKLFFLAYRPDECPTARAGSPWKKERFNLAGLLLFTF